MSDKNIERELLHSKLIRELRPEALAAAAGERFIGEHDVASRYGVSAVTAREALRALVQEGLVVRHRGSGTYIADRMEFQPVGVLLELDISHPRTSPFHLRVAQRLCTWFREHGLRIRLYAGTVDPGEHAEEFTAPEFADDFSSGRLCGAAVVYGPWGTYWKEFFSTAHTPNIGLWNDHTKLRVHLDYAGMLGVAIDKLVTEGRRRIALIGWGMERTDALRIDGLAALFRRYLGQRGLEVDDSLIRTSFQPAQPGAGWEGLHEIWASRNGHPDGLIVLDDMLFSDVCAAIASLGIDVPGQLAVVTHANANVPLAAPFPFSRAAFDPDACAEAMGSMLLAAMRRESAAATEQTLSFEWHGAVTTDEREVLRPRSGRKEVVKRVGASEGVAE